MHVRETILHDCRDLPPLQLMRTLLEIPAAAEN